MAGTVNEAANLAAHAYIVRSLSPGTTPCENYYQLLGLRMHCTARELAHRERMLQSLFDGNDLQPQLIAFLQEQPANWWNGAYGLKDISM